MSCSVICRTKDWKIWMKSRGEEMGADLGWNCWVGIGELLGVISALAGEPWCGCGNGVSCVPLAKHCMACPVPKMHLPSFPHESRTPEPLSWLTYAPKRCPMRLHSALQPCLLSPPRSLPLPPPLLHVNHQINHTSRQGWNSWTSPIANRAICKHVLCPDCWTVEIRLGGVLVPYYYFF